MLFINKELNFSLYALIIFIKNENLYIHIVAYNPDEAIFPAYSNECALKDKSLEYLFCNVNSTRKS
ncbi:MAG: hypothetical protein ABF633_07515 [Clostridium sp.]